MQSLCLMLTTQLYLVPKFKKERYYAATRMHSLIVGLKRPASPIGFTGLSNKNSTMDSRFPG